MTQSLEKIKADVIVRHKITEGDLVGCSKMPHLVAARKEVTRIARQEGYSFPRIGKALNKHHTTIIHYENQLES